MITCLADFMSRNSSHDFNTDYEVHELNILVLKKWNLLNDASQCCDRLIQFTQDHGYMHDDPAPLQRAWRQKGRILSAQGRIEQARAVFFNVMKSWEELGGSSRGMSKEYVVFEDLAKICKLEGRLADAKEYYQRALNWSNLAYKPGNSNSLRIEAFLRSLEL